MSIVEDGYGTYVAFYINSEKTTTTQDDTATEIVPIPFHSDLSTRLYTIFQQHSLEALVETSNSEAELEGRIRRRYHDLRAQVEAAVHADDSHALGLAFIPRTLYELMYVTQYVQQVLEPNVQSGLNVYPLPLQDRLDVTAEVNLKEEFGPTAALHSAMMHVVTVNLQALHATLPTSGLLSNTLLYKLLQEQLTKLRSLFFTFQSMPQPSQNQVAKDVQLLFEQLFSPSGITIDRAEQTMTNAVMTEMDSNSVGHFLGV